MAGTVTYTRDIKFRGGRPVGEVITFSWLSGTNIADKTTTETIVGKLGRVVTNPGSAAPTADYDITIEDAQGMDVMGGALADRHTSTTEQAWPSDGTTGFPYAYVDSTLKLDITAAGTAKDGSVTIHIQY